MIYEYKGRLYPEYLKHGNAMQHIVATAQHFCKGEGVDVGAGKWPFPGSVAVDTGRPEPHNSAINLPQRFGGWDYVFSSHCLEHLPNPVEALQHWGESLRSGGTMFLYLPHPAMEYWRPQNCRKHLHLFYPDDVAQMLWDLGFRNVIQGDRDLAWSFAVVSFKGDV